MWSSGERIKGKYGKSWSCKISRFPRHNQVFESLAKDCVCYLLRAKGKFLVKFFLKMSVYWKGNLLLRKTKFFWTYVGIFTCKQISFPTLLGSKGKSPTEIEETSLGLESLTRWWNLMHAEHCGLTLFLWQHFPSCGLPFIIWPRSLSPIQLLHSLNFFVMVVQYTKHEVYYLNHS